jgi:hypothetical protein
VAIRGIDIAMDGFFARQRSHSKVNSLCYCHDSVMTEYANHLESHVGEAETTQDFAGSIQREDEPGLTATLEYISERISEITQLLAKQFQESTTEVIRRVLARFEEVHRNLQSGVGISSENLERDLAIIDELLVAGLRTAVAPEQLLEWEKEAKKELKVYRKRLPKDTYEKIHSNFIRDKIHRYFKIGELSIFRL